MKRSLKNFEKGFSFIEVLIAMAILLTGTLAAISLSNNSSKSLGYTQNEITATEIGSNLFEDLLDRYSSDPLLTQGAHTQSYDLNGNPVAGGFFTANWTVNWETPVSGIMTIQLSVTWIVTGLSQTVNFQTSRSDL